VPTKDKMTIADRTHRNRLPLLAAQQGAWFSQLLAPDSPALNVGEYVELVGELDQRAFRRALASTLSETDALNVEFGEDDGQFYQRMRSEAPPWASVINFDAHRRPREAAMEWMRADVDGPVDITRGAAFSDALLRIDDGTWFWYRRYHQIVLDGFGWSLFARRVAETYTSLTVDASTPPSVFGRLADVVQEESDYQNSNDYACDELFWSERRAALINPFHIVGSAPLEGTAERQTVAIPSEVEAQLLTLARTCNVRVSRLLVALVALYLHRHTGEREFTIALPVTGRMTPLTRCTPCKLSNVLPLGISIRHDASLSEFASEVARDIDALVAHQRYRGEDIRRQISLPSDAGRYFGPIVNINRFSYDLAFGNIAGVAHNVTSGPVEDLGVILFDRRDTRGMQVLLECPRDSGPFDGADSAIARFVTFLASAGAGDGRTPTSRISVLGGAERRRLLVDWNDSAVVFGAVGCLHELFVEQARTSPEAVAVVSDGGSLTYGELDRLSMRLASLLQSHGVAADVPVGIWMDRSAEMVVGLLAVLRAGGAYVPLDPELPESRVAQILSDARAPVLLTDGGSGGRCASADVVSIVVDLVALRERADVSLGPSVAVDNLVSIYYTSGSTGAPKGVASTHRGWVNQMSAMQRRYGLVAGERVLQKTVLSFDDAACEIFWPLMVGGIIAILPGGLQRDPRAIVRAAIAHRVSVLQFVPSMLGLFLEELGDEEVEGLRDLRHVISSGERLSPELVELFFQRLGSSRCELHNQWGATEVSIDSTAHTCELSDALAREVSIGSPIANNQVYVLDPDLEPVPVGVPGGLYLGGVGLARCYLGDPIRTAMAFIPDPFGDGDRLYRTGDRGMRGVAGQLVFQGRADYQVKIRGIRIEPGEIEHALRQHPGVSDAVVVKWEPSPGDHRLAAYVVASDSMPAPDELSGFLTDCLPAYMVPTIFIDLDVLPLTPSGKLDRRRLPTPWHQDRRQGTRELPATETELLVAEIWSDVLSIPSIDIRDNFFSLGGHSLLATQAISRLRRALETDIPLSLLFNNPTIARMARALNELLAPLSFPIGDHAPQPGRSR
jgi:enterobactin synthetase component F